MFKNNFQFRMPINKLNFFFFVILAEKVCFKAIIFL